MRCAQVKKIIPIYLDGGLEPEEAAGVKEHLSEGEGGCPVCQRELQALERSWQMLGEWQNIGPAPGYVSRFWTKVSLERPWHERVAGTAVEGLRVRRLAPVYVAVCVLVITGIFSLRNYWQMRETQELIANLNEEEFKMAEDTELAENFVLIQDMDFLEDLEVIESLDSLEV